MTTNKVAGIALVGLVLCSGPSPAQVILERPAAAKGQQQGGPRRVKKIDCSVSPDLCMTEPVALGCGTGRHWSSSGSGVSHCVDDDRDCKDGKPAKRDEYDNLVCPTEKQPEEPASEAPTGEVKK